MNVAHLLLVCAGIVALVSCGGSTPTLTHAPTPTALAGPTPIPILTPIPLTDTVVVKVEPASARAARGQDVEFQVVVEPGLNGVSAGEITLSFDPALLQVVDIEAGDFLGANPAQGPQQIDNVGGQAIYALARVGETVSPSTTGTLATIILRVQESGTSPEGSLIFSEVRFTDDKFEFIPNVEAIGGVVEIQ